jgi:apolipoprotein N-acyltransferase
MQQINIETWIKLLTSLVATATFAWGIYQFFLTQRTQTETRRIEATKPFLDRQLKLYTEATQAAAMIATSDSKDEAITAQKRFWSLYWGELALVEDKRVEMAMVQFGNALERGDSGENVQGLSLDLAHACRDSLAESWGVKQWRKPSPVSR